MPIILECVLRAAGNETRTERERGTQKGRARGQSVRDVGIFRLLTGVCEMQILGVTIVTIGITRYVFLYGDFLGSFFRFFL